MSLFSLTGRRSQPQPDPTRTKAPAQQGGFSGLRDVCAQALNAIKSARPSVAAERREQEQSQSMHRQSPEPVHHDPFVARTLDPNCGKLGGRGSGAQSNARVEATRPGTSGRVGGPAVSPPRQNYVPGEMRFPKTLD